MQASPPRRRSEVALGIVALVAGSIWSLLWGIVALVAWSLGGDTTGWVICSAALAAGAVACVFGICLVRGRQPSRLGWLGVGGIVLALLALPAASWLDDREAAPVNRAVQRVYAEGSGLKNVTADCSRLEDNRDGSESWICDFGFASDYDVCLADIRREQELVAAKVHGCSNDTFKP